MKRQKILTITDIVDILLDFDVVHDSQVLIQKKDKQEECYGATDFNSSRIMLCDRVPQGMKRLTVLHELYHARDWRDGYQTYENQTEDISARHYKKLYGHMHLGRKRCQSKV